MGNSQSSSLRSIYKSINKSMTNVINTATTSSSNITINKNNLDLEVTGFAKCNIDIGQVISSNQTVKTISKFQSAVDLKTLMKNAVEQTAKNEQTAVNDFLSLGFNSNKNSTELVTEITNIIDTNIKNENITTCNNVIDNVNNGKIKISGNLECPTALNILQTVMSDQVSECVSETLINVLLANDIINDAVQSIENKQKAENKGITDFLKGLVGPLIIIAVIIVLVLIAKSVLSKPPQPYMGGGGYGGGYGGPGMSVNMRT